MYRRRNASNRHWVFVKRQILSALNDQLAMRHGAEYTFEVPESSFDWDVEFSVIKDRSGNTLREQYMAAWVQPSLVAPGEKIYQLGVRINWRNPDVYEGSNTQLNSNEVSALMAKVDGILGSPIETPKKQQKEETLEMRPTSVTNQKSSGPVVINSSVNRLMKIANQLSVSDSVSDKNKKAVDICFGAMKSINDAKKLDSIDLQQIEIQNTYDQLDKLQLDLETAIIGFISKNICDKLRTGDISDEDVYDMLSRIYRQITGSKDSILRSPDFKLKAINDIESLMMSLLDDTSFNGKLESLFYNIEVNQLSDYLKQAAQQTQWLRDKSLKLNISDIPAPQVVEDYVEEIKENSGQ